MVKVENDCCGCAVPGYPCRGESCSLRHVKHYYCDDCGNEIDIEYDNLYQYSDKEQLCEECLLARFEKVKEQNE